MTSLPFNRQASRDLLMSAEDKGRTFKSSLTEGSTRLFGSVMDAKKGILGGITSKFDQVVNIVGGGEEGEEQEQEQKKDAAQISPNISDANTGLVQGNTGEGLTEERTIAKTRPPKPPAPMNRQRSDLEANGKVVKQTDGGKISRQNTAPTGPGSGEARGHVMDSRPPLVRRNTNPFMDDYDASIVEQDETEIAPITTAPDINMTFSSYPRDQGGIVVAPAQQGAEPARAWNNDELSRKHPGSSAVVPLDSSSSVPRKKIHPAKNDDDSDADSEATEGCDEERNAEDFELDEGAFDGGTQSGGGTVSSSAKYLSSSKHSDHSMPNDAAEEKLDPQSRVCIEFMKTFVEHIFDPR